jgi:hypothetical protein
MFESLKESPRKWAVPAIWVLLSVFWLMIGIKGIREQGPFRSGWHLAAIWSFILVFWLYRLYRAFKLAAED